MSSSTPATDAEKVQSPPIGLSFADNHTTHGTGNSTPSHHHHHFAAHTRERLKHFLHPDGRRIHIAASPDEAQKLRRRLESLPGVASPHTGADNAGNGAGGNVSSSSSSSSAGGGGDAPENSEQFEVLISGSPEHLDALRVAHSHHEDRRSRLRDRHQVVYEQFAEVHAELDALARELERVTTHHGVSLEAHFNRFGYNAFVRSYDEGSPSESGVATPRGSISSERTEVGAAERGFAVPLKLFKVPVLRQYFYKGVLWRASGAEEVQSFELFVDLLYVGIIAINGDAAAEHPSGLSLLRFVITFTLSFKIWNDMALLISWFETDDVFQRISILFLLSCLFGYTTNLTQAFDTTYATLIGFYLAARFYMAAYLVLVAFLMPTVRGVLAFHVLNTLVGAALWIGSIHTPYPAQLALIFVAMFIDIVGQVSYAFFVNGAAKFGSRISAWSSRIFEFTPAINIEHRTERMNAFVTLVFGYTVVAILYQSTTNGIDAFFGKGILGLVQAFVLNWLYFEVDAANLHVHAIRRARASAMAWMMAHLPFIMAVVLGGGALARLVVAADGHGADVEHLTEEYRDRSTTEIEDGIRWFYCAGFGVALACMGAISISHVHRDVEGLRWPKRYRLAGRFAVAIVLVCLPLAKGLDSVNLVGTVTGLLVLVLVGELWATSCCHEKLIGRTSKCKYTGRCGKRQLEALMKNGTEVNVDFVDALEKNKEKHRGLALGP